jgi:hypothetical protein
MEVNMDKMYKYVEANRDQTIILSVFLMAFGLALGLTFCTIVSFNYLVISYSLLFGIFPVGVFLLVYLYYTSFYDSPKKLFIRCVAFISIWDIFFCVYAFVQVNYYWIILYLIFIFGLHFMNKGKSK